MQASIHVKPLVRGKRKRTQEVNLPYLVRMKSTLLLSSAKWWRTPQVSVLILLLELLLVLESS
jgi:hypothetical protein